jgi:glycosyltransferase involved in cell wall biosynthesis
MINDKNIPTISIIMPTLNSEKTIEKSLKSVRDQDYDQSKIEILVVDGGSTDNTHSIAKKYNANIIPNPKVEPQSAKLEGIKYSKSKYVIFLDSDEVLANLDSISRKIQIMESNKLHFLAFGGYRKPEGYSFINEYINIFSEPFSNFIYGVATDYRYFITSLKSKFQIQNETDDFIAFKYSSNNIPLFDVCASNVINLVEYKKHKKDIKTEDIPKIFYEITKSNKSFFVIKNDYIYHYSSDTLNKFLKKIRWRIISNIFFQDETGAGFVNRENYSSNEYKKYIFILYGFSIIAPLIESIYKSIKYKNIYLLVHLPLTLYTVYLIAYYYLRYILKMPPKLTIYG